MMVEEAGAIANATVNEMYRFRWAVCVNSLDRRSFSSFPRLALSNRSRHVILHASWVLLPVHKTGVVISTRKACFPDAGSLGACLPGHDRQGTSGGRGEYQAVQVSSRVIRGFYWVAAEESKLSYHKKVAGFFTIYPYYGNSF